MLPGNRPTHHISNIMALNARQLRFIDEYMVDLNATTAYKRAGYQAKGNAAEVNAARLLRNAQVAAEIARRRGAQSEKRQITAERIVEEIAHLAMSDIGEIMDFSQAEPRLLPANQIPERARRAIQSVKVKRYWEGPKDSEREVEITEFRLWPKNDAIEKLYKMLGFDKTLTDEQRIARINQLLDAARTRRDGSAALPVPGSN